MVKFTIVYSYETKDYVRELTKFSREFNTYGVGEELLHPVRMNESFIGPPQPETNLATYLITFKEFQKSNVEIKKNTNKAWFRLINLLIFENKYLTHTR